MPFKSIHKNMASTKKGINLAIIIFKNILMASGKIEILKRRLLPSSRTYAKIQLKRPGSFLGIIKDFQLLKFLGWIS